MKTVLITGGTRGIGFATVSKFAHSDFAVILNYVKSDEKASKIREQFLESGLDIHLFKADVSDVKQVNAMFDYIEKYFKHLDVLVNNAGVSLIKQCQDVTDAEFDEVMGVNAKGTFNCCRAAVRMFVRQQYGAIVNVSSVWGLEGASCESVYSMSKHAVVGLTKSLALELASCNVKVNCVCPPIVKTDMCSRFSQKDIDDFCLENHLAPYLPEQVADDIFRLAKSNESGVILQER